MGCLSLLLLRRYVRGGLVNGCPISHARCNDHRRMEHLDVSIPDPSSVRIAHSSAHAIVVGYIDCFLAKSTRLISASGLASNCRKLQQWPLAVS